MEDQDKLIQDFYAKYAPDQELTPERLQAIKGKYGNDSKKLLQDFYSKYAPDQELTDDRYNAISKKYSLDLKKKSQPQQGEPTASPSTSEGGDSSLGLQTTPSKPKKSTTSNESPNWVAQNPQEALNIPLKQLGESIEYWNEAYSEGMGDVANRELVDMAAIYENRARAEGTISQKIPFLANDATNDYVNEAVTNGLVSEDEVKGLSLDKKINLIAEREIESGQSKKVDDVFAQMQQERLGGLGDFNISAANQQLQITPEERLKAAKMGVQDKISESLKNNILYSIPENERTPENLKRIEKELHAEGYLIDLTGDKVYGDRNLWITDAAIGLAGGVANTILTANVALQKGLNIPVTPFTPYTTDFRKEALKKISDNATQIQGDIEDNILSGDFRNVGNLTAKQLGESAPFMAISAATGGGAASYVAISLLSGSQYYMDNIDEEGFKDLSGWEQLGASASMGGFDAIGEIAGTRVAKRVLSELVKDVGGEAGKTSIKQFLTGYGKSLGINVTEEFAAEGITGAGQYATEAIAKGDEITIKGLWDAFRKSGIAGAAAGVGLTSVGKTMQIPVMAYNNIKAKEISSAINNLKEDYKEAETLEEKGIIFEEIAKLQEAQLKVANRFKEVSKQMNDEDTDSYMTAIGRFNIKQRQYEELDNKEGKAAEILKDQMQEDLNAMQEIEGKYTEDDIVSTIGDNNISQAISKGESINIDAANKYQDDLINALDRAEASGNEALANLIEEEFNKVENYDKKTKTVVEEITEKRPVGSPQPIVKQKERKPTEQIGGLIENSQVVTGSEVDGEISVAEIDNEGNVIIKRFNQKSGNQADTDVLETGKKPEELEFIKSNLDENGNVESVTLRVNEPKGKPDSPIEFTVVKRNNEDERPLDIAIASATQTLGEIPQIEFEQAYETVTTRVSREVPIAKGEKVDSEQVTNKQDANAISQQQTKTLDVRQQAQTSKKMGKEVRGETPTQEQRKESVVEDRNTFQRLQEVAKSYKGDFKKGATEQRKQIRDFANEIKETLKGFKKGVVTAAKAKSIANRAAKVTTENQLDSFLDYASKVLESASYQQDLTDTKRKQGRSRVRRKKGGLGSDAGQTKDALRVDLRKLSIKDLDRYNNMVSEMLKSGYDRTKVDNDIDYFSDIYREQAKEATKGMDGRAKSGTKDSPEAEFVREEIREQIKDKKTDFDESKREEYKVLTSLTDAELGELTLSELQEVSRAIENIENFLPIAPKAIQVKRGVVAKRNTNNFKEAVKDRKYNNLLRSFFGKIFPKDDANFNNLKKYIRNIPLNRIDTVIKGKKGNEIYKTFIQPLSVAYSEFIGKVNSVQNNYNALYDKVKDKKSFDIKASLIALQKQKEANPNRTEIGTVDQYIEAIKEAAQRNNSFKNLAQNYVDVYESMLTDGKFDWQEQYDKLSDAEKKAFDYVEEISDENKSYVEVGAARNGKPTIIYEFYTPLNVMFTENADLEAVLNDANSFISDKNISAPESKNFTERTKGAKPIYLDFSSNFIRANRSVLQDYYLRDKMRILSQTFNAINKDKELDANQLDFSRALSASIEEVGKNIFINNYYDGSFWSKLKNHLSKRGYQMALASAPRAAAEFVSNLSHAVIFAPNNFNKGLSFFMLKDKSYKASQNDLMEMVRLAQSSQFTRLFQKEGGLMQEQGVNLLSQSTTKAGKWIDYINDQMVSVPDRAIAKPLWIGTFVNSFEKSTGQKLNVQKFIKDSDYREKFSDEIEAARDNADSKLSQGFATMNPFEGIIAAQVKRDDNPIKIFDKYMTRFIRFEYQSLVDSYYGLVGMNELSRQEALALAGATMTRMALYQGLYRQFSSAFSVAIESAYAAITGTPVGDREEDDDDKEKNIQKLGNDIYRGAVGSALSLAVGRRMGNIGRTFVNFPLELMNREYGEMLGFREEGEGYNPYNNSLVFSNIKVMADGQYYNNSKMVEDFVVSIAGPYSKLLKATSRGLQLQMKAGVPYYFNDEKEWFFEPTLKTKDAIDRNRRELRIRIAPEIFMTTVGMPLAKDVDRLILREAFEDYNKDSKKSSGKKYNILRD